jgi:hypothetical protein
MKLISSDFKRHTMITNEMIHAGVGKALDLGMLPRTSIPEDFATNSELMEEILQAALDIVEGEPPLIIEPVKNEAQHTAMPHTSG